MPPDSSNFKLIESAIHDLQPRFRHRKDLPFGLTPDRLAGLKNLYLITDLGPLDCLTEVAAIGAYPEVVQQSEPANFPFGNGIENGNFIFEFLPALARSDPGNDLSPVGEAELSVAGAETTGDALH